MRQIYIVNATQVVASESNPQGVYSVLPDYPKRFDSRTHNATEANPNGDPETALIVAQADYADAVRDLTIAKNSTRVGWVVTLERWDGAQLARKSFGAFPDMTPAPEPEPEPTPEEEPEVEPGE